MGDKNNPVAYYKMTLEATESGLQIYTKRFLSVKETPSIHFCVSDYDHNIIYELSRGARTIDEYLGDSLFEIAKKRKMKIYRILKVGSRIASPTEQKALDKLLWMKQLQVKHLERNLKVVTRFLELVGENPNIKSFPTDAAQHDELLGEFSTTPSYWRSLPDTLDFVHGIYRFD